MFAGEMTRLDVELAFTVWLTEADALVLKLESPPYVAINVRLPAVVKVIVQLPEPLVSGAVHDSLVLAATLTVPVGVVTPVTLNAMVTAWETFEGLGAMELMAVVLASF